MLSFTALLPQWRAWPAALLAAFVLPVPTSAQAAEATSFAVPADVELTSAIPYGRSGGKPLLLELARPKAALAKARAAVVFIHGGAWSGADRSNGLPIITLLAQHGFVAVSIDYRLSGVAAFPAQLEDSKCAVRFLRAKAADYGVDPTRIGVAGGSAGGHLAALVGLTPPEAGLEGQGGWPEFSSQVSAVCDLYGISDLVSLLAEQKLLSATKQLMRGNPAELPELYRQASPLALVRRGAPPFYLAHGDKDNTVPLSQSEKLVSALRAVGTEATLRVVPGMGHGAIGTLPQPVKDDMVTFFKNKLGPVE